MLAVYFACCICDPLMVVAFLFFLFFFLNFFYNSCSVGKVGRDRKLGSRMRSFPGIGKPSWPTGTDVYLHTGFSTIFRWNDRQMDRQADGQYWDGPAWAVTHRNSEDFLWVPLLHLSLALPSHLLTSISFCPLPSPRPHLSLWCTLNHCDEEWKFKGTPSPTSAA